MSEFILELFGEEIPAGMQKPAVTALEKLFAERLKAEKIDFGAIRQISGPRRLALVIDGLPEKQPDVKDERKGPKVGAPEKAVEGFLRGAGLESLDQCEQRDTPKGAVWFAIIERKGQPTSSILVEIIKEAVAKLPWAKSMRFAKLGQRWVRPLRRVNAVFAGQTLEGEIDMHGGVIPFGNETEGHRFLGERGKIIPFTNAQEYVEGLREAFVIADREERKEIIATQLKAACLKEDLTVKEDNALLEEVTGLVEWPVALLGSIDDEFMEVPREVLTSSMRTNQKYFTLENASGDMSQRFGLIANITATDGGKAIIAGNEKVLRARLADAKFFWDQDLKKKLEENLPKLEKVVFHAKLGTVADRVKRMAALAEMLSASITGGDAVQARRAAELSKADLVSDMVFEFPEVQGKMGRYYALKQGEEEAVANAIADHYSPAGPSDACPTAPVSVAVALAEKLDILAGFWIINEKPTGSKDPFALRRAALGVIRLILENDIRVSLKDILTTAMKAYNGFDYSDETVADLMHFFVDRLKVHLKGEGVPHDHISAVFALSGEDDLVRILARVKALGIFLTTEDGVNLLAANKRAANILRAEEKKEKQKFDGFVVEDALIQAEEKELWESLVRVETSVAKALQEEAFETAMEALSQLRSPLDQFFDQVTVNAEDLTMRKNRLNLLAKIHQVMGLIAAFDFIEG